MKRNLSFWRALAAISGLLIFALAAVCAQQPGPGGSGYPDNASAGSQGTIPANMGRIHGKVINPTGQPQGGGTVSLSTDGGVTLKYTFPVSDTGEYTGDAPPGTYMVIYRQADTPAGKENSAKNRGSAERRMLATITHP